MGESEPIDPAIIEDTKRRLIALGFTNYEVQVTAPPGAPGPSLTFLLPNPQTVLQLRTLARSLHFKYLKEEGGRVVGTTYMLAGTNEQAPLGLVDVKRGERIIKTAGMLAEAVKELPANRPITDPAWNDMDFAAVIHKAAIFRAIRDEFSNITQVNKVRPTRIPDPEKLEQIYRRVREFHRLRKKGMSVRNAQQRTHCDPRTYYTYCEMATGEAFIPA